MQAEASRTGPETVMHFRANGSQAQKEGRHGDAVVAFKKALAAIPSDIASAGRDANAARLQLLVHISRSLLALRQGKDALADLRKAERTMSALDGAIPPRAIETVRAAVLANSGFALAMLGEMHKA